MKKKTKKVKSPEEKILFAEKKMLKNKLLDTMSKKFTDDELNNLIKDFGDASITAPQILTRKIKVRAMEKLAERKAMTKEEDKVQLKKIAEETGRSYSNVRAMNKNA